MAARNYHISAIKNKEYPFIYKFIHINSFVFKRKKIK